MQPGHQIYQEELIEKLDGTAVILAGGRGSRMGGFPKEKLVYRGETFLQRKIRLMAGLFSQVVVSSPWGDGIKGPAVESRGILPAVRYVCDLNPEIGPLMGLLSAFQAASSNIAFVSAVDAPLTSIRLAYRLAAGIGAADAYVPIWNGYPEPLCAVYRTSTADVIERSIKGGGRKVTSFYRDIRVRYMPMHSVKLVDPEGESFININTMEEYCELFR